jgi:hypothetical protein
LFTNRKIEVQYVSLNRRGDPSQTLFLTKFVFLTRVFSNFENLEELHLTNAFTEQIDSKWYLSSLKDIFVSSNLTKLKKLHLG